MTLWRSVLYIGVCWACVHAGVWAQATDVPTTVAQGEANKSLCAVAPGEMRELSASLIKSVQAVTIATRANAVRCRLDKRCTPDEQAAADIAYRMSWHLAISTFHLPLDRETKEDMLSLWDKALAEEAQPNYLKLQQIQALQLSWDRAFYTPTVRNDFLATTDFALIDAYCTLVALHGTHADSSLLQEKRKLLLVQIPDAEKRQAYLRVVVNAENRVSLHAGVLYIDQPPTMPPVGGNAPVLVQ